MARKFKIGDTVQVVKCVGNEAFVSWFKEGHRGVVIDYDGSDYPYAVKRKNGFTSYFKPQELKLIRKGK